MDEPGRVLTPFTAADRQAIVWRWHRGVVLVAAALAVFSLVLAYLALVNVEPVLAHVLIAASIACVAAVFLLGLAAKVEDANVVLVRAAQHVVAWASARAERAYAIGGTLVLVAILTTWLGTWSVHTIQIDCSDNTVATWVSEFGVARSGCPKEGVTVWWPGANLSAAMTHIRCKVGTREFAPEMSGRTLRCVDSSPSDSGLGEALGVVDERVQDYFVRAANVCIALEVLAASSFEEMEQYATLTAAAVKYGPAIEALQIQRSQYLLQIGRSSQRTMKAVKEFLEDLELELHRGQMLAVTEELFPEITKLEHRAVSETAAKELKQRLRIVIPQKLSGMRNVLSNFRKRYDLLRTRSTTNEAD